MKMRFVIILLLLLVVQNAKSQESLVEQHETNINNIVEQCRILYPFDETKDTFSDITKAQKHINICIENNILNKAKKLFNKNLYEQFETNLKNIENETRKINKLIFLGDTAIDINSANWMELWIIEQRITEILEKILKDIIQQEKWAN
ncbi:MAG: hypothetical protein E7018_06935 [Alphaproteobacteria bacterium]|nr:hypothetical protein [Alphaproteobacteria bacterium]